MTLRQSELKKIYIWVDENVISIPGIYQDAESWLISLSNDWVNWMTIADKNIWATSTDTSSTESYGNIFQWWNNYGFPTAWAITVSTWRVSAATYWPWNYYTSSTFIASNSTNWDTSNNTNLWWWGTGTNEARRWPCQEWFHVPSQNDFNSLWSLVSAITWWWDTTRATNYLKMMPVPYRYVNWDVYWATWRYWTSDSQSNDNAYWYAITTRSIVPKAQANALRPFKNTPTQPTATRTVLYQ